MSKLPKDIVSAAESAQSEVVSVAKNMDDLFLNGVEWLYAYLSDSEGIEKAKQQAISATKYAMEIGMQKLALVARCEELEAKLAEAQEKISWHELQEQKQAYVHGEISFDELRTFRDSRKK